jgi:hypothetical protein
MRIEIYNSSFKSAWDDFVRGSKNGTFLFFRDYMDYHRDRFTDNSLLVFDDKEKLLALLPANKKENELTSHGGLSYGGFVTDERMKADLMLEVFRLALASLKEAGFTRWIYKTVPHIFHRLPAEEDLYALFRVDAVLFRRDVSSAVQLSSKLPFQERRSRAVKKAANKNVSCRISTDYASYWRILEENLTSAHNLKPVHSLPEIEMLRDSFPDNIKLFAAFLDDEMIAGTLIYETGQAAHAQYIASSAEGRSSGALDLLFHFLLTETYAETPFFNFGISTENQGRFLNSGLIDFKEGFGGRAIVYDAYKIDVQ